MYGIGQAGVQLFQVVVQSVLQGFVHQNREDDFSEKLKRLLHIIQGKSRFQADFCDLIDKQVDVGIIIVRQHPDKRIIGPGRGQGLFVKPFTRVRRFSAPPWHI